MARSTSNATLVAKLKPVASKVEALPISSKLQTESCCRGTDLWSALGSELAVTLISHCSLYSMT
jgi:hypothetical protein